MDEKRDTVYRIELTEAQMRMLMKACEVYFRERIGQFNEIAEDVALATVEKRKESFNSAVIMRDCTREILETAYRMNVDSHGKEVYDSLREMGEPYWEMYTVMRHELWKNNPNRPSYTVDADEPMQVSEFPLIKCWKKNEEK